MDPTTTQDSPPATQLPPLPPTGLVDDEVDAALAEDGKGDDHDDDQHRTATMAEEVEYLGSYPGLVDYLRAMLEPEICAGIHWIFDTLDWDEVLARFEEDGSRYFCERGQVFRTRLPLPPEPGPVRRPDRGPDEE